MRWVDGCAAIWGDVSGRAAALLVTETDPRFATEMLPDWERAFGLPDPCSLETPTVEDRHAALLAKMTTEGGQSRAFFIQAAAALGYTITIREYSPVMAGVSRCGDTRADGKLTATPFRCGAGRCGTDPLQKVNVTGSGFFRWQIAMPDIRFWWTVSLTGRRLTWFRMGQGQCGVDPMVRIGFATDLECVLRRWKPAHTDIVFDYSAFA